MAIKTHHYKAYGCVLIILMVVCALCIGYVITYSRYTKKWWYRNTGWQELKNNTASEVIVAVIDTGINTEHEALEENIWFNRNEVLNEIDDDNNGYVDDLYGWNFVSNNNQIAETEISHSTAVAGLIIGDGKVKGIASSAPVKIMSLEVLDDYGESYEISSLIQAIKYAENNGASICNCSFGLEEYSTELYEVMKASNMLFIVSAGNSSKGCSLNKKEYYPATFDLDNMIVVSACDEDGNPWIHSNYGSEIVDVFAVGVDVYTCSLDGYDYYSGVSMSVPLVTGVAAIIESYSHSSEVSYVKNIMQDYFFSTESDLIPYCKGGNQLIS